jgi:hypothetical protein
MTSTLLSLLVVPVVFTYIDDLEHVLRRLVQKMRRHDSGLGKPGVGDEKHLLPIVET